MQKNNGFDKYQLTKGNLFSNREEADAEAPAFLLSPTFDIEKELIKDGFSLIAGIDEAGRGALAGPLSIGIVIYSKDQILSREESALNKIKDSKKLTAGRREFFFHYIRDNSLLSQTFFASHKLIDSINVNRATEYLIKKFLEKTDLRPDVLLIDGNFSFNLGLPSISICKGDSRSITIASASVMAKVKRDNVMERLHCRYQEYNFSCNKGYGTRDHIGIIKERGCSRIHRKSYEPLKSLIEKPDTLFP